MQKLSTLGRFLRRRGRMRRRRRGRRGRGRTRRSLWRRSASVSLTGGATSW